MLAMIESYLVIGAGYIFLGFGGSRWTAPYAEKYVSQVVSIGARLMVFYLVIGLGQQFATQWIADSQVAATGASANLSLSWTLAAQVAMYAVICWTLPKLVSNVIGGTLSASGGDAIAMGVAAGTAAISGAAMLSGVGAPAAAAGGASAVSSVCERLQEQRARQLAPASVGAASTAAGAGVLSSGSCNGLQGVVVSLLLRRPQGEQVQEEVPLRHLGREERFSHLLPPQRVNLPAGSSGSRFSPAGERVYQPRTASH